MTIEHASTRAVVKPWGSTDLLPWSALGTGTAIGEIWFQRPGAAEIPALLLKLLFTDAALSIQVHPDDAFAQSIGLQNGKTEAWYILAAAPGARVAAGLKRQVTPAELRTAITDGSIAELVHWRSVKKGEVVFVPAGTIHAAGAGLVLAEIQQQSDTTFRLFDHGGGRELHVDQAVGAAQMGPARAQAVEVPLSGARTVLVSGPHFVMERIELAASSAWVLQAEQETWLLGIEGQARIGNIDTAIGDGLFLKADCARIEAGSEGFKGLVAYVSAKPSVDLLSEAEADKPVPMTPPRQAPPHRRPEIASTQQPIEVGA